MSESHPEQRQPMEPPLSEMEARILGVLMEKQLTTPDVYPLTLNSVVVACNQKSSREPVTHYNNGEVQHCLRALIERKLVQVDYGSRAERYDQRLTRVIPIIDRPGQAILNVMMLRGPQTVHELLTRTQRMHEFSDDQAVEQTLSKFCENFIPLVQRIPRQSGQREDRYMHLLSGPVDIASLPRLNESVSESGSLVAGSNRVGKNLEERLQALEQRVAALERQLHDNA